MIMPRIVSYVFLFTVALFGWPAVLQAAQASKAGPNLTVEEVVKLSNAEFSDELIITRIKKHGKAFDLSAEELVELRKAGVNDNVIRYLLDPSQPYTPPAPPPPEAPAPAAPPPAPPAKQYPPDPNASKIPNEPGLYLARGEAPVKIDVKVLLGANQGAGLGKVMLKKGKVVAYLVGPAAKTRIQDPMQTFYLRLPEGKGTEEVVLLALEAKDGRREIDLGPAAPKQEIKAETTRPYDSLVVGDRLFRVKPAKLAAGEYLFFLLGSAEPPKGSQGKGYDFGLDESARK